MITSEILVHNVSYFLEKMNPVKQVLPIDKPSLIKRGNDKTGSLKMIRVKIEKQKDYCNCIIVNLKQNMSKNPFNSPLVNQKLQPILIS